MGNGIVHDFSPSARKTQRICRSRWNHVWDNLRAISTLRGVFPLFGFAFLSLPRGASLYCFDNSAGERFSFVVGVK